MFSTLSKWILNPIKSELKFIKRYITFFFHFLSFLDNVYGTMGRHHRASWADTIRHHGPTPYGTMGRHHTAPWADTMGHMGGHHTALWADTIRTMGIVQDNVLHLTVQIRHLHHCAGKFPTLDGEELRTIVQEISYTWQSRYVTYTIVQENFLHLTVESYRLGPLCRKISYTWQSRYVTYTIVQKNFLHLTVESCRLGPLCRKILCTSLKKLKYFLHVPEVCFPHLASEY